jgi:diguanylate cyclase (GGDEF)-like protein/PAS domain S-box-containing protein
MEEEYLDASGVHHWVETFKAPVVDVNGGMLGTVGFARDISDRKKIEIDMRIAATVFESQEGMLVTDANNIILRVNRSFTNITGYTAEEVIGKNPRILQSGQQDANFYASMWKSINTTGSWQGEVWNRRKNGEVFPEHLTITAVKDQNGIISNYVATLTDITLSKAAVDKIEHLAFYDPLTGLPNRRLLQDRLKPALASSHRSGRQGALLFIDMDNFKILNDTLGHDMGDLLLQQVAQRLESCMREGDTVARLGGDEFVVMLEDLSEQTLEAAAQTEVIGHKILAILNQVYLLAMHEYRNTPSIGATLFNGQEQSIEELLKQADIAMYQAKASGRNALRFFDPQMQACITARVALEKDLRLALEEDQFILYYQPQVHHGGQIIGAEVLIRWQHPLRGLVSPADFIPIAEETHLILPIGQWVLKTACIQLKIWEGNEHTRHLQLAVNVSSRQFYQEDFVAQVAQILSQSAINPNMLKLELTESLVLDDIEDTIFKMNALRKIGVRFSMDDFGTGYSSLSSLKKLPLDQLKIDQSFVRDISIDQDDTIIVETIIAMANKLNIEVIAEGVETEAQRAFLEQHDCQLFQGYLFSKPVPIKQFELLLKKNSF